MEANTVVELKVSNRFNKLGNKLKWVDVQCIFLKNKSWYSGGTNIMLDHEQGHFDIGEINARLLRKRFYEISKNDSLIDRVKFQKIFNEYIILRNEMQVQYDSETHNSMILSVQHMWEDSIRRKLLELNSFKHR